MKSSKYLIAGGTVNYTEGLAKYYAEDEKKRRDHGERLRQRDEQALKIQAQESPIKMLEKLAGLSQTVGTLVRQRQQAEQNKEGEYRLQAQQIWSSLDQGQKDYIIKSRQDSVKDLQFDAALFESKLKLREDLIPVDLQKKLIDGLGGNHIHLSQQMGFQVLYGLDDTIEAKDDKWKQDLDVIKQQGNTRGEIDKYKNVAYDEWKKLGFNQEFIAANFEKSLEKYVNSKGVIAQLYYQNRHNTAREVKLINDIPTAQETFHSKSDVAALTNLIHQQKLKIGDTDRFVAMYAHLSKTGQGLTYTEIVAAKEYALDPRGKFKAGNQGEDLLSKDQWEILEQAALSYSKSVVDAQKVEATNNLIAGMAELNELAQTATIEELVAKQQQIGRDFISSGGDENNDLYQSHMSMDVTKQSPGAYAKTREEYKWAFNDEYSAELLELESYINDGGIPNQAVAGELGDRLTEVKRTLDAADLPTSFDDLQKWSRKQILKSGGQEQNIATRETEFSDRNERFQRSITLRRINKIIKYSNDPNYKGKPKAAEFVATQELLTELDSEGFNVKNLPGTPGVGPASPDVDGQYRGFEQILVAQEENNRVPSSTNVTRWTSSTKIEMLEAGNNVNTVLSHDRVISKTDTLGAFVEDSNPTDGFQYQTKIYYSPELIFKSLAMKKQPGTVLKIRLKNIIANPDNKDFVRNHGLKEKLKLLENAPDLVLERFVQSTGDQKLITKYNQGGVLMFSQAELEKLSELEKQMQATN